MKAKTMNVLDINSTELKFGVKIQINNRRSVYLAKEKKIFCVETQKEAQEEADYINLLIRNDAIDIQSTEDKIKANKNIKVISF